MNNLTLLALDTSTEACSVALLYKGEKTYLGEVTQRTHTKHILPMIDRILTQSNISLNQVDALVFGCGPGSFTGVRVGAGIAQGLALGADLPVIAVSSLTAMAQAAYEKYQAKQVIAVIDARMNEVYFSQLKIKKIQLDSLHDTSEFIDYNLDNPQKTDKHYDVFLQWEKVIEEQVCCPQKMLAQIQQDANTWLGVGTGWKAYSLLRDVNIAKQSDIELPSARYMLSLALPSWYKKQIISAVEIEPVYLRNEVTWKKLSEQG